MGLEDAKIVMSVKNPESLVKGSTVRTGIPRRRRPARPVRSGRALRLLWLLSPRASAVAFAAALLEEPLHESLI